MSEDAGVNGTAFSTKMEKGNFFRIRCHSKERASYDIPIIFLETSYLVWNSSCLYESRSLRALLSSSIQPQLRRFRIFILVGQKRYFFFGTKTFSKTNQNTNFGTRCPSLVNLSDLCFWRFSDSHHKKIIIDFHETCYFWCGIIISYKTDVKFDCSEINHWNITHKLFNDIWKIVSKIIEWSIMNFTFWKKSKYYLFIWYGIQTRFP